MSDTDLILNWRAALKLIERKLEEFESEKTVPKILFVEDDPDDIFLFKRSLDKYVQCTTFCRDSETAKDLILKEKWDLVFLDYRMPKLTGMEVLKSLDPVPESTQFFIISGSPESQLIEEVYKLGRVYVPKLAFERFLGTVLRPKHA